MNSGNPRLDMADVVNRATRSRMMSGIRGTNTKPELRVRRALHRAGLRYRLHAAELPGKPDIVLRPIRTAVFVHGCFWHQHPGCRYAVMPSTNVEFWAGKLGMNSKRDQRVEACLRGQGWQVEVVWECADESALLDLSNRLLAKRILARQSYNSGVTFRPSP